MAHLPLNDAALGANTPAFVQAPSFVFTTGTTPPTRSEMLRRQIEAARGARSSTIW